MSFDSHKKFFDDTHFPHGFRRSGDFTRAQADILESMGEALKALHEGTVTPATDEEQRFVDVCRGQQAPVSPVEKAWHQYLAALRRKQVYYTASSGALADGGSDSSDNDD